MAKDLAQKIPLGFFRSLSGKPITVGRKTARRYIYAACEALWPDETFRSAIRKQQLARVIDPDGR